MFVRPQGEELDCSFAHHKTALTAFLQAFMSFSNACALTKPSADHKGFESKQLLIRALVGHMYMVKFAWSIHILKFDHQLLTELSGV